jgi:hypothetical protein
MAATVAVAAAVSVIGAGNASQARTGFARAVSGARQTRIRTPPTFAAVDSVGSNVEVELLNAATGKVAKVLGSFQYQSWTNNGLAYTPDGRYIFFTLIPQNHSWKSLLLERLSVATGQETLIGPGEQPAISPDGRLLGYVAGENRAAEVVVRDLVSGAVRKLNVSRLLGGKTDMLNASLVWTGDGSQLAVFEGCCAVLQSWSSGHHAPSSYTSRLVVVSAPQSGKLTARRVLLPRAAQSPDAVGTDASGASSVLVASLNPAGDLVQRLRIGASTATLTQLVTIPQGLVMTFSPTGRKVIYVAGHPVDLWEATIEGHKLVGAHVLIERNTVGPLAW